MRKIEIAKVKKLKGVGLEIAYNVTEENADTKVVNKYKTEITEQPCNELLDEFQNFDYYLAETLNLSETDFLEVEEIKTMGKGENMSIIVKAKYYTENDLRGTIISPRMRLYNDTFGFEMRMQAGWDKLSEEVKSFLFEDKRGEVESFN